MFAERSTLNGPSERVEALHDIYSSLLDIESELTLMRRDLTNRHGVTDTLMSHPSHALSAGQKSALDAYMLEIVTWHKKAATVIERDVLLKNYYERLLAINGATVFLERFQDFLRSHNPPLEQQGNF